jgi:hypothetical protein
VSNISVIKYLRKLRGRGLGGSLAGGGGGGGAVEPDDGGGTDPEEGVVGGTEFRGEVCTLPVGGGGGVNGTFCGSMLVDEDGEAEVADNGVIGMLSPGGSGSLVAELREPGSTTVLESLILGFVPPSFLEISANAL